MSTADNPRDINRWAVASLVASACLCAPVGAVLGVVALVQIRQGKGSGTLLAGLGLLMSLVVLPLSAVLLLTAEPAVFDSCRALQHQAEGTLRVMRFLQDEHRGKHGRYGSAEEVGFTSMYGDRPYAYVYELRTENGATVGYTAKAVGNNEMAGDLLVIRDSKPLERVRDVCHDPAHRP